MRSLPINSIINEDCLEFLPKLPDESIDLIITDPPYAISSGGSRTLTMKNIKKQEGFGGDWKIINEEWDTFTFDKYCSLIRKMLQESYRVLKKSNFLFNVIRKTSIII